MLASSYPLPKVRTRAEVESPLGGQPGIGQQCDVGDGKVIHDQILPFAQVLLHEIESIFPSFHPPGIAFVDGFAPIDHIEATNRDIGLVAYTAPKRASRRFSLV